MADASDHIVVATLPKNARDVIRVQITSYRGHHLLNVRVYDRDGFRPRPASPSRSSKPPTSPPRSSRPRPRLGAWA